MPLAILLTLLLGALCGLINAGLIIYTKVNPLVITLGTLYISAGSALLLTGMAGATVKVLVDSRWRLQISLTWMCWDCRSADYLPDMSPRFIAVAA